MLCFHSLDGLQNLDELFVLLQFEEFNDLLKVRNLLLLGMHDHVVLLPDRKELHYLSFLRVGHISEVCYLMLESFDILLVLACVPNEVKFFFVVLGSLI